MSDRESNMESLLDWLEGRLAKIEAEHMSARVADDPGLADEADWLRTFLADRRGFELATPPADLRGRLESLIDRPAKKPGMLRQMVARLMSDSWNDGALAGVRSLAVADSGRQMLFSSEMLDIALSLRPSLDGDHFDLSGQLLPLTGDDSLGWTVELISQTGGVHQTESDPEGVFNFSHLHRSEYIITLTCDGYAVTLPAITWSH